MLHSVFSRFLQIFQANNLSRSDWIGFNKDINKFDDVYLEIFALSYRNNETFFKKLLSLSNHVHKSRIFDAQYHFSMKVILSYRVIAADINRIRENELWSQKNDEIVECLYETHPNLWRDFDGAQSGADLKKNAIEYVKEMLKNDSNEYNHKIAELYAVIKHFIKDNINIQQEFSRILINGAHMSFNFYKNYNKSNNLVSFFLWLLYFFNKHQKNLNTTTLQLTINPDQYYEWLEVLLQFSGTTPNTFISPKDFFEGTDELFGSFLDLRHNTQLEWAIAECVTRRDHTMLKGIRNFAISDVAYRDLLDVLKKIVQNTPPECTAVLMMAFHALPRVEFNMLAQGCLNKHNITCVIDLLTNGFTNYDNPIYCAIIKTLHGPHSYLLAVLCNDI
ncbi:MAG: hypothetical protein FJ161_04150, partial [Gammaproteobacteria bacterium]|nr:hypothetical protein [Gammaproteobacteria bacterium]